MDFRLKLVEQFKKKIIGSSMDSLKKENSMDYWDASSITTITSMDHTPTSQFYAIKDLKLERDAIMIKIVKN